MVEGKMRETIPLNLSFKANRRRKENSLKPHFSIPVRMKDKLVGPMTRVETVTRKPDDPAPRHGALDGARRTTCTSIAAFAVLQHSTHHHHMRRASAHTGIRRRRERHAARAHAPRDRPDELSRPGTRTGRGQWQFGATEPSKQRERETKSIIRNDMNGINKINKPIDIYTLHPNHISMFCLNGRPSHYE
jgi:hypothetical protein